AGGGGGGGRDAASGEMVAADDEGGGNFSGSNQIVYGDAEVRAVSLSEPADSRRKALEFDLLLGERNPATEMVVVRKELEREVVGALDVFGIARQRDPAERSLPCAEKWSDVLWYDARNT